MLATPSSRLIFGLIPWYSALIVTGICVALWLAGREEKRLNLPRDTVIDLALWVIPFGVVGARLYYVAFAWNTFASHPLSILFVWQGGLAIYGGILGGLLAIILFAKKKRLSLPLLTDMIVPGLALAQAIGRWGNYFNMEAYGLEISNPAWQFFPLAVLIPGPSGSSWHMATFFYESVWNLMVFAALYVLRKRTRRPGDLTLWYMLLYGTGRLIIEGLRTDSLMAAQDTLRISQVLSVVLCLISLFIWASRSFFVDIRKHPLRSLATFAVLIGLYLLLPCPVSAFVGYHAACLVLMLLSAMLLTARLVRLSVLPLLSIVLTIIIRTWFAVLGFDGIEAATVLNMVLSLSLLTTGVFAYFA